MGDDGGKFAKAAKELKEETRVTLREIAATWLTTRKGGRKMEKATFHDHLTRLRELFPERETITVAEAARLVGCKPQTLRESRDFPMKPVGRAKRYHVVPIINLARWMAC